MKKRNIPEVPKAEWTATGSFMHKPKQGWLHSNEDIARGITYRAVVGVKSENYIIPSCLRIALGLHVYLFFCIRLENNC